MPKEAKSRLIVGRLLYLAGGHKLTNFQLAGTTLGLIDAHGVLVVLLQQVEKCGPRGSGTLSFVPGCFEAQRRALPEDAQ